MLEPGPEIGIIVVFIKGYYTVWSLGTGTGKNYPKYSFITIPLNMGAGASITNETKSEELALMMEQFCGPAFAGYKHMLFVKAFTGDELLNIAEEKMDAVLQDLGVIDGTHLSVMKEKWAEAKAHSRAITVAHLPQTPVLQRNAVRFHTFHACYYLDRIDYYTFKAISLEYCNLCSFARVLLWVCLRRSCGNF